METPTQQLKTLKPKLSRKRKAFAKDFALTENGTEAALKNYDIKGKNPDAIAASIANENLKIPEVIQEIENKRKSLKQALIDKGIDENKIADKVNVLLDAEDPESGRKDYTAIDKGLKHATAIFGINPEGPKNPSSVTYNFLFSKETQDSIAIINKTIKDKLINVQPD